MNEYTKALCHHGILGQKWGVRRYQPYPANYHGEGKYVGKGAGKKFTKKLKKAQRFDKHFSLGDDRHSKTSVVLAKINQGPVRQYVTNSESYKRIEKLQGDRKKRISDLNTEINQELLKKYNADPKKGPGMLGIEPANYDNYLVEGIQQMQERSKSDKAINRIDNKLAKESKVFEKEAREFFSDFMGKYGQKESPHPNWTKVNAKTGEVQKPTLTDVAVMGVLQDIGMLPYFLTPDKKGDQPHGCSNQKKKNSETLRLIHTGVEGMKWGERRYQNYDGSLTPLGRIHYGVKSGSVRAVPSKNRGLYEKNALISPEGFESAAKYYGERHKNDRSDRLGRSRDSFDDMSRTAQDMWMHGKPGMYDSMHQKVRSEVKRDMRKGG